MFQPPTDNLYKFLAIFGLLLFGFSFYIPLQRIEQYNNEFAKWNAAYIPLIERASQLSDDSSARLQCAIERARAAEEKKHYAASETCKRLATTKEKSEPESRSLKDALAVQQQGKMVLENLRQHVVIYQVLAVATGTIGVILCVWGFWLWYVRVQKPLDAMNRRGS